jgi:hypothetical protein
MLTRTDRRSGGVPVALIVIVVLVVMAGGVLLWLAPWRSRETPPPQLTQDARLYVRAGHLALSEVEMKASENFAKQTLIEITGRITNKGDKTVNLVEITCVFRDPYGMVVFRERMPIVGSRTGALKAGETKTFRLPFDTIPETWNQALPELVIAQILFG